MKRREFIKNSALAGTSLLSAAGSRGQAAESASALQAPITPMPLPKTIVLNLQPARWIWYPSQRTLQNTFVLFRRQLGPAGKAGSRAGMGGCRQPLPVGSEWPTRAMGAGAVRPALAGSGPHGFDGPFAERAPTPSARRCCSTARATARGRWGSAALSFGWKLKPPTARSKPSYPTKPGKPSSPAPGSPAITSVGICAALQEEFDARLYPLWLVAAPTSLQISDWLPAMPLRLPGEQAADLRDLPGIHAWILRRPRRIAIARAEHPADAGNAGARGGPRRIVLD